MKSLILWGYPGSGKTTLEEENKNVRDHNSAMVYEKRSLEYLVSEALECGQNILALPLIFTTLLGIKRNIGKLEKMNHDIMICCPTTEAFNKEYIERYRSRGDDEFNFIGDRKWEFPLLINELGLLQSPKIKKVKLGTGQFIGHALKANGIILQPR